MSFEARPARGVLAATVGFVVAGVPLFFLRQTTEPFDTPKLAFLLIGVGISLAIGALLRPDALYAGARRLMVPIAAILVPGAIATAASPYREWAMLGAHGRYAGFIPYAVTAAVAILVAVAFRGRIDALLTLMVVSAGSVAAYSLIQMFGLDPLDWFSSAYVASTVGHSNFTGAVFAMALPLALAMWMRPDRKWLGRVAFVMLSLGLIGSFSQGAWVAGVCGCAVTGAGLAAKRKHGFRSAARLVTGIAAVMLVLVVVLSDSWLSGPLGGSSAWTRALHWQTALTMAADAPIVGHGANTYALIAPNYRSSTEALIAGSADDPHSIPLSLLAHGGVIAIAGLAVLAVWIRRSLRLIAASDVRAPLAGAIVAFALVALVTVDHLVLRTLFWALLGASVAARAGRVERSPTAMPVPVVAAIVALSFASAAFGIAVLSADIHTARALDAWERGDEGTARRQFRYATGFGGQWQQRWLYGDALGRTAVRSGGVTPTRTRELRDVFEPIVVLPHARWRTSFAYWLSQWSTQQAGLVDDARDAWAAVRDVAPNDPRPAIALAELALFEGQPQGAVEALRPLEPRLLLDYQPGVLPFGDYWGALAIARAGSGDLSGASSALAIALAREPGACHALVAQLVLEGEREESSEVPVPLTVAFRCPAIVLAFLESTPGQIIQ